MGHLDIITRAAAMFDEVIVGVVNRRSARPRRCSRRGAREFVQRATEDLANVQVAAFLTSSSISRTSKAPGHRQRITDDHDFEYEFEMNQLNHEAPDIECPT